MTIGNFEKGYRAILNQLFNINGIPLTINCSMESFGSKFSRDGPIKETVSRLFKVTGFILALLLLFASFIMEKTDSFFTEVGGRDWTRSITAKMFVTPDLLKNLLTSFQCKEQSSSLI
jgi:hypothetical protein